MFRRFATYHNNKNKVHTYLIFYSRKIFWSFYQIETKIMKSSERRKLWLQWGQNQDANTFSSVCAQRAAACFEILVISSETRTKRPSQPPSFSLDTVQDFLIKLGIKPRMHLLEIGIFSLYHVIFRPTKIVNRAD